MGDGLRGNDLLGSPAVGARVIDGRHLVLRPLKPGLGLETFLAIDQAQGEQVVVKAVSAEGISAGGVVHLEHDVELLQRAWGPHLAGLKRVIRAGDHLYLVTPHVPGVSLQERLIEGPLSVTEALTVGHCLLAGLRRLHGLGSLHRAVKPSNVILDGERPLQHAVLIDVGLARVARLINSKRDRLMATARYVSPEEAGLLDFEVDERSDLYAVGTVLFECLAGRPLFPGDGISEILRQHLATQPPMLRDVGVGVPLALDEAIQRLLLQDPRDRYQTAEGVLVDLDAIAEAVTRGAVDRRGPARPPADAD